MAVKIRDSNPKVPDAEVWLEQMGDVVRVMSVNRHGGDIVLLGIKNVGVVLYQSAFNCGIETDHDGKVKILP